MDKIPFSVYDFFGYLASGFIMLISLAASFAGTDSWQKNPSTIIAVLLIIVAYITGQVVSNIASVLFEFVVVVRWLRRPSINLMAQGPAPKLRSRIFPGYYRPLPPRQRDACLKRAGVEASAGQTLFYAAFVEAKQDPETMSRLTIFLNQYGFSRNMTLVMLVAAACLAGGSIGGSAKTGALVSPGWCALLAGLFAVGLFYRYLKFFRLYSQELFVFYARQPDPR